MKVNIFFLPHIFWNFFNLYSEIPNSGIRMSQCENPLRSLIGCRKCYTKTQTQRRMHAVSARVSPQIRFQQIEQKSKSELA